MYKKKGEFVDPPEQFAGPTAELTGEDSYTIRIPRTNEVLENVNPKDNCPRCLIEVRTNPQYGRFHELTLLGSPEGMDIASRSTAAAFTIANLFSSALTSTDVDKACAETQRALDQIAEGLKDIRHATAECWKAVEKAAADAEEQNREVPYGKLVNNNLEFVGDQIAELLLLIG